MSLIWKWLPHLLVSVMTRHWAIGSRNRPLVLRAKKEVPSNNHSGTRRWGPERRSLALVGIVQIQKWASIRELLEAAAFWFRLNESCRRAWALWSSTQKTPRGAESESTERNRVRATPMFRRSQAPSTKLPFSRN